MKSYIHTSLSIEEIGLEKYAIICTYQKHFQRVNTYFLDGL